MTSKPLVRRTLATLRSAEFGFFGVVVYTRVQTPRFCGFCSIAGTFDLAFCGSRPLRTSWLIVGMKPFTFHVVTLLEPNNGNSKRTTAAFSTPRVRVHPAMFKRVWTRNEPCPDGRAYTLRLNVGQW